MKSFRFILFLAVLYLLPGLVVFAFGQPPQVGVTPERKPLAKAVLKGTISDCFGKAITGATITVGNANTVSDMPGNYRLEISVPDTGGTYLTNVEAIDYKPKSALVKLMSGDTTSHKFVLIPIWLRMRFLIPFKPKTSTIENSSDIEKMHMLIKDNPECKFEIQSHCFDWVSNRRNLRTSQRRAEVIRKLLLAKGGIDSTQIIAKGYGSTQPAVGLDFPAPRKRQKSRVALRVLP